MNIFTFFADKPERMVLISILFLIVYVVYAGVFYFTGRKFRRLWPILALAGLWFGWGLWESHCSGASIRVDMLFLLPFIFGLTIGLILCQLILLPPKKHRGE